MRVRSKLAAIAMAGTMMLSSVQMALAANEPAAANVKTDSQLVTELGVLQGDGNGVTPAYLAKTTTRIQAAILFLRLKGLEQEALAFKGADNFSDADLVGDANKAIMAYLKANPGLGWTGTGDGRFDPLSGVTAQQYYKVLLDALGYKQDADFAYADTIGFAATRGLSQIADAGALRNGHIAAATAEALKLRVKGGDRSLAEVLAEQKAIDAGQASQAQAARIEVVTDDKLGSHLVDENGKTLYTFAKDGDNASACKDQCAVNWPIYYAENILVPDWLNAADFKTIVREDGGKQTTYKGKPLYYFAKDVKAGDANGQGVNDVWFVVRFSSATVAKKEGLGSYLTDSNGRTLYLFTKDGQGKSVCSGTCEANWPIFYSPYPSAADGLKAEDFGTIVRDDGTKQTTYKGSPLYYFAKDERAGDTKGQGVNNVWYVIQPAGAAEEEKPGAPAGTVHETDIANFAFVPEMTIKAGDSIKFTNRDPAEHNVVSDATVDGKPLFETPLFGMNESYTLTFDKPGEYTYYCEPHKSFMKGKIIVQQ
ncbi:plastocyanin/azurin family copper-binding protein [Paenibacillus flagellatus]|uniref:SLH domain-containing protein n=1 Tax=Paenibacillus flagellatus TaxID=2211139 RepID=A0A2V5KKX4_9BACL|nr:plastocyanin/azurin family copper-binding protein [Paenibacillus flagellatus]PYI55500.1 hypothetical protein DLM86_07130 [Paenibacillus flagellatus]